ncbi:MAG TPA: hypothetical protein VFY84_00885 [Jiangellales bacterium]|nr:hypothetical protein [Jiangellales bacterium]
MGDTMFHRREPREPRRGEVVRVRSREEILATLDAEGRLDELPFMPEMLEFCGRQLTVAARADKSCDTINWTGHRRMEHTVFLTGTRCSGAAHGGCEAGCNLFWREEWLEWPDRPGQPIQSVAGRPGAAVTVETLAKATRAPDDDTTFRCQATEHFRASAPMGRYGAGQYIHDVRIRNVSAWTVLRGILVFVFNRYQRLSNRILPRRLRIRGGLRYPFLQGTGSGARTAASGLKPGDLVEVRSKEEILPTLAPDNRNRGMSFDTEMLPYCGRRARVQRSVGRIINENTGKLMNVADCVVLEDVVCKGTYHRFCQRAITPYWREAWLRRVDEAAPPTAAPTVAGSADDSRLTSQTTR